MKDNKQKTKFIQRATKKEKEFATEEPQFEERLVQIDRVTYVVSGGKRLRFRALVVAGNRAGKVGYGIAKAQEVPLAIEKAARIARKNLVSISLSKGTIPHPIIIKSGAAKIILKPGSPGTSLRAGGAVRVVLELAGVTSIISKILGSNNKINNARATIEALSRLKNYEIKPNKIKTQK